MNKLNESNKLYNNINDKKYIDANCNETTNKENINSSISETNIKYQCLLCNKQFKNNLGLICHLRKLKKPCNNDTFDTWNIKRNDILDIRDNKSKNITDDIDLKASVSTDLSEDNVDYFKKQIKTLIDNNDLLKQKYVTDIKNNNLILENLDTKISCFDNVNNSNMKKIKKFETIVDDLNDQNKVLINDNHLLKQAQSSIVENNNLTINKLSTKISINDNINVANTRKIERFETEIDILNDTIKNNNLTINDFNTKISDFDVTNANNLQKIESLETKIDALNDINNKTKTELKLIVDSIVDNDLGTYKIKIDNELILIIQYEEVKLKNDINSFAKYLKNILNKLFDDIKCCDNYLSVALKILKNNDSNKLIDIDEYFHVIRQSYIKWTRKSSTIKVLILTNCSSGPEYITNKIKKMKMGMSTNMNNHMETINECVICLTNKYNVLMLPCSHICCCNECSKNIIDFCPICRTRIKSKHIVHYS